MDYVSLGASGLKVSRLCLGCKSYGTPDSRPWVLPEAEIRPFFARALELRVNFSDTADIYSHRVSDRHWPWRRPRSRRPMPTTGG